jgi:excisionase family DNA binding protein
MPSRSTHTRQPPIRNGPEINADLDRGITVARAAELLGCDPSTVRRLIKSGSIEGWRVSTRPERRGHPRLSLASIQAWRHAHKLESNVEPPPSNNPQAALQRPTLTAAHRAAVANLKELGII